ncbi:putative proteasome endopeptidase complex [Dioscorea sansibarensis]
MIAGSTRSPPREGYSRPSTQSRPSSAIGLRTKEGVVLAVEKRVTSPLLEPSSVEKIMEIDEHIRCAMSGVGQITNARTLGEHARVETQNHRSSYGEPMNFESTTQAICDSALHFGEGNEESMTLYHIDSSDTFWQCNAKATGSGSEGADSSLQEQRNNGGGPREVGRLSKCSRRSELLRCRKLCRSR